MADGRVTYEFEADYSNLEKDVKKAGKIVSDSSDETAKKQKKNDKEVSDSARQAADDKTKAITDGNKSIVSDSDKSSKAIIKSTDDLKKSTIEMKLEIKDLSTEYKNNRDEMKNIEGAISQAKVEFENLKKVVESSAPNSEVYVEAMNRMKALGEEARVLDKNYNQLEQLSFPVRFDFEGETLTREFHLKGNIPSPIILNSDNQSYFRNIALTLEEL